MWYGRRYSQTASPVDACVRTLRKEAVDAGLELSRAVHFEQDALQVPLAAPRRPQVVDAPGEWVDDAPGTAKLNVLEPRGRAHFIEEVVVESRHFVL